MIRALIVDDEYFVRMGLIHMIPWSEHGIEIVGEASSGERALEFIRDGMVDLLITDLTMPIMSGFELIKQAQELQPSIRIVVLTCHQEFSYVQEALRLGAMDYVVKTELENDTLYTSIERISERINLEQSKSATVDQPTRKDWALLMIPFEKGEDLSPIYELTRSKMVIKLRDGAVYIKDEELKSGIHGPAAAYKQLDMNRWVGIALNGASHASDKNIASVLDEYLQNRLFYEYRFSNASTELDWEAIAHTRPSAANWDGLKLQWRNFFWVYQDDQFDKFIQDVRELRPPVEAWLDFLRGSISAWSYFSNIEGSADWLAQVKRYQFWEQWIEWLSEVRMKLRNPELSQEVCTIVLRAVEIMNHDLTAGVNQSEVANKVNINRSYLSYCFKQYVGKSFQDLLSEIRIARAIHLLSTTTHPIYWISEQVGFQDEKYFSKFFKQHTGRLPKELRKDG